MSEEAVVGQWKGGKDGVSVCRSGGGNEGKRRGIVGVKGRIWEAGDEGKG